MTILHFLDVFFSRSFTVENIFPELITFLIIHLPNQYAGNLRVKIWLGTLTKQIGASSCNLNGRHPLRKSSDISWSSLLDSLFKIQWRKLFLLFIFFTVIQNLNNILIILCFFTKWLHCLSAFSSLSHHSWNLPQIFNPFLTLANPHAIKLHAELNVFCAHINL